MSFNDLERGQGGAPLLPGGGGGECGVWGMGRPCTPSSCADGSLTLPLAQTTTHSQRSKTQSLSRSSRSRPMYRVSRSWWTSSAGRATRRSCALRCECDGCDDGCALLETKDEADPFPTGTTSPSRHATWSSARLRTSRCSLRSLRAGQARWVQRPCEEKGGADARRPPVNPSRRNCPASTLPRCRASSACSACRWRSSALRWRCRSGPSRRRRTRRESSEAAQLPSVQSPALALHH